MKIFVTGGSGFVGTEVVKLLVAEGIEVVALARSDASANSIKQLGPSNIEIVKGDLTSYEVISDAAKQADAVIHCAFIHDFDNFAKSIEVDSKFIEVVGKALAGSNKAFEICSGMIGVKPDADGVVRETSKPFTTQGFGGRHGNAEQLLALASSGIKPIVVRLPPTVHGKGDHAFVPYLLSVAQKNGVSAYHSDDVNWGAVHVTDAASLLVKVILNPPEGGAVLHAVAEEKVPTREIAEAFAKKLNVPVKKVSAEELAKAGLIGSVFGREGSGSSQATQKQYNWKPTGPSLVDDIVNHY